MATYTSTSNSKHATLVANTADTVTLDKAYAYVQVVNNSSSGYLYVVLATGSADTLPSLTVNGDGTFKIGPGAAWRQPDDNPQAYTVPTKVQLISDSAVDYSVYGLSS